MSSEAVPEAAPMVGNAHLPRAKGLWALGGFVGPTRTQTLSWNRAGWGRDEGAGKPCERGVYVCQRLSFHSHGKARIQQDGVQSRGQNRTREIRPSGIVGGLQETWLLVGIIVPPIGARA